MKQNTPSDFPASFIDNVNYQPLIPFCALQNRDIPSFRRIFSATSAVKVGQSGANERSPMCV